MYGIAIKSSLLIAIGVAISSRCLVETIIIVNSTVAAGCLHENLVDVRMRLGGGRDDRRERIVDVGVGYYVIVQLVQDGRQVAGWRFTFIKKNTFT
jgi:hypothetical protein